jgi:lactoylglutathione lyase
MMIRQLDHVALHVADVEVSRRFYSEVLLLKELQRPAFDFPGAWFRVGTHHELHLIGDRTEPVHSGYRGTHVALAVDELDSWERHLDAIGATRLDRKIRPDGLLQTFLMDPDGHWIELNCSA